MKYLFRILTLSVLISCKSNDCLKLPTSFKSYEDGLELVESTTFNFTDNVDTSESSWIRGASYYSCEESTGFLIINTDSHSYIHQSFPLEVWKDFKKANSFGSFYNRNIKGRYQLQLN